MAMGRRKDVQEDFWVATQDLPSSLGHPFYERLNELLDQGGFDRFCESSCEKFCAAKLGRPSVPAALGRARFGANRGGMAGDRTSLVRVCARLGQFCSELRRVARGVARL